MCPLSFVIPAFYFIFIYYLFKVGTDTSLKRYLFTPTVKILKILKIVLLQMNMLKVNEKCKTYSKT